MAYNFPGVPAAAMAPMGRLIIHKYFVLTFFIVLHISNSYFFPDFLKVTFILS